MNEKPSLLLEERVTESAEFVEPAPSEKDEPVSDAMALTLVSIGQHIRKARMNRSMTLKDLSTVSGISISMLSLVERGRVSPSIGSLLVVADALGVSISDLVADPPTNKDEVVIRQTDQRVIEHASHVIRRLVLDDQKRAVSIAIADFPPNSDSSRSPHTHSGYEYGFVLEGKITVEVSGTSYDLSKGDLISYSSRTPHRIWNRSKRSARTVWFNLRQV